MSIRLPRFSRSPDIPQMEIAGRDLQILKIIYEHRFLNSLQMMSLVGGSSRGILHRLQLLYHHGFLERPRCQLDYYHHTGSRPIVYGLGDKGLKVLAKDRIGIATNSIGDKNRSVGRPYLEHVLCVSDVMIAIEVACRNAGCRLITKHEFNGTTAVRWRVKVNEQIELGVMPDRQFSLEFLNKDGGLEFSNFFLEADRGTMPIVRTSLSQSSISRKLMAYHATWRQGRHRTLFGVHRFRVLTVTTTPERLQGMIHCCSRLEAGHGLFLFADRSILQDRAGILSAPLRTGNGKMTTILG